MAKNTKTLDSTVVPQLDPWNERFKPTVWGWTWTQVWLQSRFAIGSTHHQTWVHDGLSKCSQLLVEVVWTGDRKWDARGVYWRKTAPGTLKVEEAVEELLSMGLQYEGQKTDRHRKEGPRHGTVPAWRQFRLSLWCWQRTQMPESFLDGFEVSRIRPTFQLNHFAAF